jgi:pilus assembly protein CpaB
MKKVFPIIIALLLAAVASWGIANWSHKLSTQGRVQEYVAAAKLLAPGHVIADSDLVTGQVPYPVITQQNQAVWRSVFQDFVAPDNRNTLVGRQVAQEIQPGFPVLQSSLKPVERQAQRMDWKSKITEGKRAIAIPVDSARAVNGLVTVGDHVDVLATISVPVRMGDVTQNLQVPMGGGNRQRGEPMTFFLLQDVEILSVGGQTFRTEEVDTEDPLQAMAAKQQSGGGRGVTVALTSEQVLMLTFAITAGDSNFTLALRTPGDQSLYDTVNKPPAGFKELLTMVNAKR